ncbi:MAG: 1-acyl-sn-glycerol-3-phosphate acyltransferase [Sphingomonadales bacterium]|jgi:1-acyl-sn-glycerol-3-phosphate acyltransferase|nr:1-acyl-sn-glycerol-3-phosphate acyltransferase [Sphingomonadales bacterium]
MNLVRSLLYALVFYPGSVLYVLAGIAVIPLGRSSVRRVADGWAGFNRACARYLLGIASRVEGEVPSGPVLVAVKHQSMFETLEIALLLDTPATVMKSELGRIPLWGTLTRVYGILPVDRDGGAAALRKLLRAGQEAVAEGRPIVIFPEGTRVAPGERPPLEPGFAGLYRALGLPVVPVALDSGKVWPRRSFVKRPGVVTMRFGDPIPPGLPRSEAEARVHAAINALEIISVSDTDFTSPPITGT